MHTTFEQPKLDELRKINNSFRDHPEQKSLCPLRIRRVSEPTDMMKLHQCALNEKNRDFGCEFSDYLYSLLGH